MIKSSRAIIADCTGNRTAVYYEAGYAMGMKIPVVWTCKEDQVKNICFDVNQHPFILWNTPEELADKVVKRLKAIL
jgi:nucleoside 2-deoxyribosyltransferase